LLRIKRIAFIYPPSFLFSILSTHNKDLLFNYFIIMSLSRNWGDYGQVHGHFPTANDLPVARPIEHQIKPMSKKSEPMEQRATPEMQQGLQAESRGEKQRLGEEGRT
jgi:hypothetical protein